MKGILMSIKPKWVEKIASGKKTIEVRKTVPKCGTPFKCYIYCTKEGRGRDLRLHINDKKGREDVGITTLWRDGKDVLKVNNHLPAYRFNSYLAEGKVVGEFVCDDVFDFVQFGMGITACKIEKGRVLFSDTHLFSKTCLTAKEIEDYLGHEKDGYGLHISDLKIYDKPKALSEFKKPCPAESDFYCNKCIYGDSASETCLAELTRPPQSWQFVEEL